MSTTAGLAIAAANARVYGFDIRQYKPLKDSHAREEKARPENAQAESRRQNGPDPPARHSRGQADAGAAFAHERDCGRPTRHLQNERPVLLLFALAGFRRARAKARRSLPLRHL